MAVTAKRYMPFGVETYMKDLIAIAEAENIASHQTVRNWESKYGKTDDGIEQMLIERFGIRNAYQLQRKIEDPHCDVEYKKAQDEIMKTLGYETKAEHEVQLPEMSDVEKEIMDAMNAKAEEEAGKLKAVKLIHEEPVDNVPDKEDLKLVNRLIRDLNKARDIPGFCLDILSECAETLRVARSMSFDDMIDWDRLAKE